MVLNAELLEHRHKGGKEWFTVPSATILNMGSGFIHKDLCKAGTVSDGSACPFSCTYCSVGATMFRSPQTRILRLLNIDHGDAVIRRLEPVPTLRAQLTFRNGTPRYLDPNDRRVVIISPIVDPLASEELLEETLELILLVFKLTNWLVRILTKSMLVRKLAERIPKEYRDRMIYGLSIGILDDDMAKVVEKLTSPPTLRLKAYHELQRQGLRTYSMHCPILPQVDYKAYAERLAASVNWEADEHIWAEALNSRGDSNEKTITALRSAGFQDQANLLAEATSSRTAWEFSYNRPLFEALAAVCPPGKLRFLVYAGDQDRDHWLGCRDRGAVVLGEEKSEEDDA
jgi:DNA repair photolyase